MSKLTVTEKEHWKQRVERRIDRAIEELSLQHPQFMPDLRQQAKRKALAALKIDKLTDESDKLESTINELKSKQDALEKKIYLAASGNDEVPRHVYGLRTETDKVVAQRQTIIEDELLADSSLGLQFLKLRREKEELLDTIWLATSNRQIRDLWSRVSEVLSEESTPLQNQILSESD